MLLWAGGWPVWDMMTLDPTCLQENDHRILRLWSNGTLSPTLALLLNSEMALESQQLWGALPPTAWFVPSNNHAFPAQSPEKLNGSQGSCARESQQRVLYHPSIAWVSMFTAIIKWEVLGMEAHACNPAYGRQREATISLRVAWALQGVPFTYILKEIQGGKGRTNVTVKDDRTLVPAPTTI